jgi:hypothetical protein
MALTAEEKERFLKAPYPPREFRYAVAGYLGVLEVLKRLDALGERMVKLERAMVKLWREQASARHPGYPAFTRGYCSSSR